MSSYSDAARLARSYENTGTPRARERELRDGRPLDDDERASSQRVSTRERGVDDDGCGDVQAYIGGCCVRLLPCWMGLGEGGCEFCGGSLVCWLLRWMVDWVDVALISRIVGFRDLFVKGQ